MKILGIETSCDETSASIIEAKLKMKNEKVKILSNIVSSQVDLHAKYGGVVPEVAARAHSENIIPALKAALEKAKCDLSKIDAIAVTIGPGLIGSLLVGVNSAKTLAYLTKKPIVGINHLEGHIYANFVSKSQITNHKSQNYNVQFPALCLIVSGGHTSLVLMEDHLKYKILGQTLDDAVGEAFDKVGKLLDLPYPGGPSIEKEAQSGNSSAFDFPRAMLNSKDYNFSFSGIKTAVLQKVNELTKKESMRTKQNSSTHQRINASTIANIASSFQQAVIDILVKKTIQAAKEYKVKTVMLAGGVAANKKIRGELAQKIKKEKPNTQHLSPNTQLCTDNAAMIAAAGYYHIIVGDFTAWGKINANANLSLT